MYATGVTVVTCRNRDGEPCGITANSFSSVSLEPPLILWNIAKVSNSLKAYLEAEYFAINVLSAEQRALSAHFAHSEPGLFEGVDYRSNAEGAPVLPGILALFECRTREIHDSGDHFIIVGEVLRFEREDGDPLLFFGGGYRRIAQD